ncbi:MAG: NRAMP family divalent metal transporter [Prochlorococcaceae cyanobacterium]|mgnify:CR=1 FL=1
MMRSGMLKALGPGILLAAASIGGSHLVASTQAGALYGLGLLGLLLLANLFKYPFLLIGSRFTAVTGRSLLEGYQHQSPWFLPLYLLITLSTGVANIAAVSSLAGSLATAVAPGSPQALGLLVLAISLVVLLLGQYRSLDRLSKAVVALLVLCTLMAAVATLIRGPAAGFAVMFTPSPWTWGSLPFLVALLGWMPCPLDLSAWTSLWIYAREQDSGHKSSRTEVVADFNIGYAATVLMAVLFLVLGAWVMHGTGTEFSQAGAAFSQQLIELYTASLGAWAYLLIALAALMTMFSTVLTCLDGYPRSASASVRLLRGHRGMAVLNTNNQRLWMLLHFALACAVLLWWSGSMGALVTLAMWVSFVTTPVLAWMNWRVMQSRQVAPQDRFGPAMSRLAAISLGVLSLFVVLFGISLV